jgi:hypothetical protein
MGPVILQHELVPDRRKLNKFNNSRVAIFQLIPARDHNADLIRAGRIQAGASCRNKNGRAGHNDASVFGSIKPRIEIKAGCDALK